MLGILALLVVGGAATGLALDLVVRRALVEALLHSGESDARVMASRLSTFALGGTDGFLAAELDEMFTEDHDLYVVVIREDWSVAAKRISRGWSGTVEDALSLHSGRGFAPSFEQDGDFGFARPIVMKIPSPTGRSARRTPATC